MKASLATAGPAQRLELGAARVAHRVVLPTLDPSDHRGVLAEIEVG